ncbi:MAG: winged helix DNA-binding protein [Eubacterium sp.]
MESTENLGKELLKCITDMKKSIFHSANQGKINGLRQSEFFMLMRLHDCFQKKNAERQSNGESLLPGIRISTLSQVTNHSMPGISQMINTLENAGYVERITTKKDRRAVFVNLTERGLQFLRTSPRPFLELFDKAIDQMGKEESRQLITLMRQFSTIIADLTETKQDI